MSQIYAVIMSFIWYSVEFMANIAVIAWVAMKYGYIKPVQIAKKDVPATFHDQLKESASLVGTVSEITKNVKALWSSAGPEAAAGQAVVAAK